VDEMALSFTLAVRDATRAVAFYARAFGAIETHRIESPDGACVVELRIAGDRFFVADEAPGQENVSPASPENRPAVRLALLVDDPDAVARRALTAGAQEVYPVADQPYGWRLGQVVDPFGHHWEIGRPLLNPR
jgi:PhnB protein